MKVPQLIGVLVWVGSAAAQEVPQFTAIQRLTNQEIQLKWSAPAGQFTRIEMAPPSLEWMPLVSFPSASQNQFTDSATPYHTARLYRAVSWAETNAVTGDYMATANGPVIVHPIDHATFMLSWNGKTIYSDPVGETTRYRDLPRADLILITHDHGDHFNADTINAVKGDNAVIIAPAVVTQKMSSSLKNITTTLTNRASLEVMGLSVEAVPAYNLTATYHVKGVGNGYVLGLGGKRIYISGDTEDIPEMRALQNIDMAFVCMNLPFTMTVDKAASAVREFRPKIVYPYHHRDSNVNNFKKMVSTDLGIEVRLRKWY